MSPSFRSFHYALRACKNIERKMLVEILAKLSVFRPTTKYQYVGFGSIYFTDYLLFHRLLGFSPMISIEGDLEGQKRAEFNRPYECVKVIAGRSEECLPNLDFSKPTVVWLDYDYELCQSVLSDLRITVGKLIDASHSGVMLLNTVDIVTKRIKEPKSQEVDEEWPKLPKLQFQRLVGSVNAAEVGSVDLTGKNIGETYRSVGEASIKSALANHQEWDYKQLVNFRYADNAAMATYGGILYKKEDMRLVDQAQFDDLSFYRDDSSFFEIDVPILTHREKQSLSTIIANDTSQQMPPVPESDLDKFRKLYRYYPAFVESDL